MSPQRVNGRHTGRTWKGKPTQATHFLLNILRLEGMRVCADAALHGKRETPPWCLAPIDPLDRSRSKPSALKRRHAGLPSERGTREVRSQPNGRSAARRRRRMAPRRRPSTCAQRPKWQCNRAVAESAWERNSRSYGDLVCSSQCFRAVYCVTAAGHRDGRCSTHANSNSHVCWMRERRPPRMRVWAGGQAAPARLSGGTRA